MLREEGAGDGDLPRGAGAGRWTLRGNRDQTRVTDWMLPVPRQERTTVLDDAELLLGVSRHLSAYGMAPATAALEGLARIGQAYEMAWRLRESQVSSAERVRAIAIEARVGARTLERELLPALETLGWVGTTRDAAGNLVSVDAFIPPAEDLVAQSGRLLDIYLATPIERAALVLLRATSVQPLEKEAALQVASSVGDEAAQEGLRHLVAINLVREAISDDGRTVVFNPNVWIGNTPDLVTAALRAEDAGARVHVGALIEEVAALPGIPESDVTSTDQRWIDFAVAQGLLQRSVVQTGDGQERRFLFSPHLGRDPFGGTPADPSGHVRQLVGSMIYAATYARYRLRNPGGFLYTLIRDGVAGDVSTMTNDYPMLETAGTVQIVSGRSAGRFAMELLQADVAEQALTILDARDRRAGSAFDNAGSLGEQRTYGHVELERAQLARTVDTSDADMRRIVDALRDVTARRSFGAR